MTTRAPTPSSASVTERTRSTGLFRGLAALPPELVAEILEYLSLKELWTAARVSRRLYAAAWLAGLFIHRSIEWKPDSGHADELAVFEGVLEQAQRKDLRLSLSLTCFFPAQYDSGRRAEVYAAAQPGADEIFPVVSAALPFLVYLSICIPDHFRPQLDSALRAPAPRLRELKLRRIWYHVPFTLPIPRDLFGGSAPLLRTLTLGAVRLPEAPVPAFRSVSHAALIYENMFPHVKFRDHFPRLNNLDLEFVVSDRGCSALPDCVDLRGLALRSLVIEDGNVDSSATPLLDAIERSVDLSAIPMVLVLGDTVRWNQKICTDDKAEVSVRLSYDRDDLLVHVAPAHRRWRRMFRLSFWDTDFPLPIGEIPNLPRRLTYLRMETWVIHGFLRLGLSFATLRSLHIDIQGDPIEHRSLQPPDYDASLDLLSFSRTTPDTPRVWAPCPLLEEITLFALHKPVTAVDSRRVAFLAHALGQFARPDAQRAALALVGIEFAQPPASALLGQTVSTIHRSAFAGRGSREDSDEGLWDYRLFNRDLVGSSVADDN